MRGRPGPPGPVGSKPGKRMSRLWNESRCRRFPPRRQNSTFEEKRFGSEHKRIIEVYRLYSEDGRRLDVIEFPNHQRDRARLRVRRPFGRVIASILFLVCAACGGPPTGKETVRITHGPILGRLGPHEIGIWARTSQPGTFRVLYGLVPDKLDQTSQPASTRLEHDNSNWIRLEGLKSNTKYYYRLRAGDGIGDRAIQECPPCPWVPPYIALTFLTAWSSMLASRILLYGIG